MPRTVMRSATDSAVNARPSPSATAPRLLSSVVASSTTDGETPARPHTSTTRWSWTAGSSARGKRTIGSRARCFARSARSLASGCSSGRATRKRSECIGRNLPARSWRMPERTKATSSCLALSAVRCVPAWATTVSSTSSVLLCGVEVLELDAGVGGREAPVDPSVGGVAGGLPGGDLAFQRRAVAQPAVQALLGEHAQLDLGHVQPAAVLGPVLDLQLVGKPFGLGGFGRLVQRRRGVGVEVVLHEHDGLGVGVVDVDQILDAVRPVDAGAPVGDGDVAPAA